MKRTILHILSGLLVSVALIALLFFFFLFANPIGLYESNNLKWIPLLIISISMYISGRINKSTPVKWLPILLLPLILLKPFNYFYFPFIAIVFLSAALMLISSRPTIKYSYLASIGAFGIFLFFLFQQPLILEKEGFGYNQNGEPINAVTLWNFNSNVDKKLPDHILKDIDDNEFNLESLKGKVYFLTFWATWCAPCIADKPELEKLKTALEKDRNIEFIDISFDENSQIWREHILEHAPKGMQLLSEHQQLTSRKLDFAGIPMHIIVDENGHYKRYRSLKVAKNIILNY